MSHLSRFQLFLSVILTEFAKFQMYLSNIYRNSVWMVATKSMFLKWSYCIFKNLVWTECDKINFATDPKLFQYTEIYLPFYIYVYVKFPKKLVNEYIY